MRILANLLTALVGALHIYFLVLEMFLWDQPRGRRIFGTTPEFAAASKALAANQGLYNGFLAAGLVWGLWLGGSGTAVKIFFLCCVVVGEKLEVFLFYGIVRVGDFNFRAGLLLN